MTVRKTPIKATKSNVTLQLTGSQINLSPRPIPITHIHWSSHCRNYPMRRSISAFGFQQKDEEHSNVSSRPLSADNIRSSNNKRFSDDFREDIMNISSSSQVFNETSHLSENIYENIINGYSENKFLSNSSINQSSKQNNNNSNNNLIPGLSSKPPLPPFSSESKHHSTTTSEYPDDEEQNMKNQDTNIKAVAEQEAFDEIIALKFQRWFPNTASVMQEESSSGDDNELELLSYKQRQQFQTCEYRCEIFKKNKKILSFDDDDRHDKRGAKTSRQKVKISTTEKSKLTKGLTKSETEDTSRRVDPSEEEIEDNYQPNNITFDEVRIAEIRNSEPTDNLDALQALEERDMKILRERQNCKMEKLERDDKQRLQKPVEKCGEPKNKSAKTCLQKKTGCSSPTNGRLKKQKKISFSVNRRASAETRSKKAVEHFSEPCFADKDLSQEFNGSECKSKDADEVGSGVENSNDVFRPNAQSPQQLAGSQIDDVLSWMGTHRSTTPHSKLTTPDAKPNNSMYEEIVDILKDIEKEEIQDNSKNLDPPPPKELTTSSPAKAIWSLLEEAEKSNIIDKASINHSTSENTRTDVGSHSGSKTTVAEENKNWNRLSDLLRYSSAELAQKVMALQLLLEERETTLQNLNSRYKSNEQIHQQQKQELEYSINKRQRLIEQLQHEKKTAIEKLETMIKESERKHATAIQTVEEKQKVELKRCLEKQIAADKIEREKWKETETKKIQERAIKGFQPELNRMTTAHEEEISEIHKCYKKQLEESEETCNRRMAVQKEKFEADKEKALAIEREIWRQKLEDEIGELEKRYQDQRKRLLAEVHVERENMERANEATFAIREKENERKWQSKSLEMQKRIEALQLQHQEEIQKLHQNLETEKQMWIKNQTMEFMEKENKIKEQCKKERDKHIELIIQKLENENSDREQAAEQKMKRLKEQFEIEIRDIEMANENLRRKLNENRGELQKFEELHSQLRGQLNQSQTECVILKEKYERLVHEQGEIQNMAKSELSTKNHILKSELNQAQLTYESQIKLQQKGHERELSQMYNKFKEIVLRKDETIDSLKKQKDAALLQCNQLEKLLDLKRKDHTVTG